MKNSDSYLILEQLIQKRLLVIKPAELITWLNNLERTGQITEQENKDLLTLAEQLNIYNLPLTEYTFLMLRTDLYLHPSCKSRKPSSVDGMTVSPAPTGQPTR
jgi:hypothetical protein